MEDAEDFDSVAAHAVGDQVRSVGDHQLAGALHAPGAAQRGPGRDGERAIPPLCNGFHHAGSGGGTFASDEDGFGIKAGQCPCHPRCFLALLP